MCDFVSGSLIGSVHRDDPSGAVAVADLRDAFHVVDLEDDLHVMGATTAALNLQHLRYRFFRVRVPHGSERFVARRFLEQHARDAVRHGFQAAQYLTDSDLVPLLEPESVPHTSQLATASTAVATTFAFSADHAAYLGVVGLGAASPNAGPVTVGILDSGYSDTQQGVNVISELDLTGKSHPAQAPDTYGHGSVVTSIVHSVAPNCEFRIYKVSNGALDAREWSFLAALLQAGGECDVVNASVGFGLHDRSCGRCGRDYHSARSLVFERVLSGLVDLDDHFVFVAAAGNGGHDRATYPARYPDSICVGSTDGAGHRSTFSNFGAYDHEDQDHPSLVFAPGGDRQDSGSGQDTYVASYFGKDWRGTSFATAYVTGAVADYLGRVGSVDRAHVVQALQASALPGLIQGYARADHGIGMLQQL